MIKILHTGDVHLDSPFSGLNLKKSELRRRELRHTFRTLMQYVKSNGIDILLIAGDLFDSGFVTRETVEMLTAEFESVPFCKVIITPGNHDPYKDNSVYAKVAFPPNVHIFKTEYPEKLEMPEMDLDIYGYAFLTPAFRRSPLANMSVENPERLNILCAHADLGAPLSPHAPLSESDIAAFGCDYTALGHVHNGGEIIKVKSALTENDIYYGYSGCLEGRDFGETGAKCAILLEVTSPEDASLDHPRQIKFKKVRFAKRRYDIETIDISGAHTASEATSAISALIDENEYGENNLLRIILTGSVSPSLTIPKSLSENTPLFHLEIVDSTLPLLDNDALTRDKTVKGEVYRKIKPLLENGTPSERETAAKALRYTLSALSGAEVVDF